MESNQAIKESRRQNNWTPCLPTGVQDRGYAKDWENFSFQGRGGFLNWDCQKLRTKDNERVGGRRQSSGLGVLGFWGAFGVFFVLFFYRQEWP